MTSFLTIGITSIATLFVTIVAGIAVERFKNRKAKIKYSVSESVPIDLGDRKIGANIIQIENISSKTINKVTIKIKASVSEIKNGGVASTEGMDYEIEERNGELLIVMPFLKSGDYFKFTAIIEDKCYIPTKPDVSIRTPDICELVHEGKSKGTNAALKIQGVIAAIAVGAALFVVEKALNLRDQSANLILAASIVGLPDVAEKYISSTGIHYYNQAPYIYALAKKSNENKKIALYRDFLIKLLEVSDRIADDSKAAIEFFIAKIELILGNEEQGKAWLKKSKSTSEKEYNRLSQEFNRKTKGFAASRQLGR